MSTLEMIAALFGLVCVGLTIYRHIGCWPTGLIQVVLLIAVFYQAKLYSEMLLQIIYVFLQLYGWYAWLHGGPDRTPLIVSRLPARQMLIWTFAGVVNAAALGSLMAWHTNASFPYVDAIVTIASLIAQWLLGRKVLESWLVWIFVDVVSIPLFLAKELYWTAGLYAVFLVMATWGWVEWRGVWKKQAMA
jgi:nicotinamide mononucleotide transporter